MTVKSAKPSGGVLPPRGALSLGKTMLRRAVCLFIAGTILARGVTASEVLNVPGEFSTIQAAIDAAEAGDTVLVAPGTYAEQLEITKTLTVRSVMGPAATIIDPDASGPVVEFLNNVTPDTELDGFTLTGGSQGVSIRSASPTLRRCIIADNEGLGLGPAGFAVDVRMAAQGFNDPPPHPRFVHCTFANNDAAVGSFGAAVFLDSNVFAVFENSIIWGNGPEPGILLADDTATAIIRFTNIEGNPDTLNMDPAFAAAYSLSIFSPAIDKGDPKSPKDPDGTRADLGAIPTQQPFQWMDLGHALASGFGTPRLTGGGELTAQSPTSLSLADARPLAPAFLVVSATQLNAPFKGGVMVPDVDITASFTVDGFGNASLSFPWPPGVPPGFTTYLQWWVADATGPLGFAASNGLAAIAQ